ncbi:MAG: RnfABCDGE type electron transport complex subunit D [Lachnospiraceae bacterium]|nr:RnfABCDGE type electron transport complex subunit D [Lachnospiraceae bacterium]MCI8827183.1 RnfABCDGE type electron transport complex subunit D [Lachnospiraceae bacterium]MCI9370587.1 RnfABCDGE type electron transport complex subunit D [Lachnospiraceae bacterium]
MSDLYQVSSNPHIRDKSTTASIMRDVIIALLPATVFGIWNFGIHAALNVIVAVAVAVIAEAAFQHFTKQKITIMDFSAAVTGLLLALNVPPSFPLWMTALGAVFAIIVAKQVFGGLGQNFMNPALAGRVFLFLSFSQQMTSFTYDGVTGATPLRLLKDSKEVTGLSKMFLGTEAGTIGETSVIALLIGAVYLLVKKIIDYRIPLYYLLSFVICMILFGGHGFSPEFLAAQICGGGLILGAFFMATDYATSPITPVGRIVFGILLGILTAVFRVFGPNAEGVSYAIIFCNLLVPIIEKYTVPKMFGAVKNKKEV